MAVNKIVYGNNSLLDLSSDTLTSADQLLEGIIAHAKDGNIITGTLAGIKHNSLYTVAEGTFTVAEKITIDNNNRFIFEHNSGFVPLLFTIKSSSTTKQNDLVYIWSYRSYNNEYDNYSVTSFSAIRSSRLLYKDTKVSTEMGSISGDKWDTQYVSIVSYNLAFYLEPNVTYTWYAFYVE